MIINGNKYCPKCDTSKSVDQFYKDRSRSDGLHGLCKVCVSALGQKWRNSNPQKSMGSYKRWQNNNLVRHNKNKRRNSWKHQGIVNADGSVFTHDDYRRLLELQLNSCAICGRDQTQLRRKLYVDHDHKTGVARGLLCAGCNGRLGTIEDTDFILKAVRYLRGVRRGS